MKKYLLTILMSLPLTVFACKGYVLGFKGLNEAFDRTAFDAYVKQINYCGKLFSWHQRKEAAEFISTLNTNYQLYGFSKGAETVAYLLKNLDDSKPEYVLTIGAYKTVDVNFDKYEVNYDNYFDASGQGQKSPGIFLNVSHDKIQKEVNKIKK
jgi:hypothetical protein